MRKAGRALGSLAGLVIMASLLGVGGAKAAGKVAIVLGVGASLLVIGVTLSNLVKQRRLAVARKKAQESLTTDHWLTNILEEYPAEP
ncbi:MAG: hypothetical protein HYX85_01610 [Chloroflexi bacterium]|nr:hypothetical protein [Chloroflexota bacterium]